MRVIPADQWAKSSHEAERDRLKLEVASEKLDRVLATFTTTIVRIREQQQGQPGAQAYDSDQVIGTPGRRDPLRYDRTGRVVEDQARQDERAFLRAALAAVSAVEALEALAMRYNPRNPGSIDQRDAETLRRVNAKPCEHCATITDPRTGAAWRVDTEIGMEGGTTVGGRLAVRMRLCGADRKHVERYGVLPESEALTNRQRKALKGAA